MSLRIWLPLNETLDNQGLDQITVTNNGATIDNNGKIGKCYSFDGNTSGININGDIIPTLAQGDFSTSFWVYNNDEGNRSIYMATIPSSNFGLGIQKTVSEGLRIYWQGTPDYYPNLIIPVQEWCHIAVVIKSNNCYCYKNGILTASREDGSFTPQKLTNTWLYGMLGRDLRTGATVLKGKMNDFRWYDHALSPLEVKYISQGLILHYPLSDKYLEDTTNLVTGITAGGQTTVNNNVVTTSGVDKDTYFTINLSENIVVGTQYTFSCDAEIPSGTWRFPLGNQNNTTLDFVLHNGHNVYTFVANDTSWGTKRLFMDDNGGTTNSARSTGLKTKIYNFQLEKKDHETGFAGYGVSRTNTIVYDTSGYSNNGTSIGSFSVDKNTPKYNVSTKFLANSIKNTIFNFTSNTWTVAFWYYYNTAPSTYQGFLCLSRNAGGDADKKLAAMPNSSYIWFKFENTSLTISSLKIKVWTHIVMTFDGTNGRVYENGVLKGTTSAASSIYTDCDDFVIGARANAANATATACQLVGNMSDVRVYATALSADDVKSLYNNSAYIDNQGNIYGAVYEEV